MENTIVSLLNCLGTFVENHSSVSGLSSIPVTYMSILMLVPWCLDFCSFVVRLELGRVSSLFILFSDCFGYSESFSFSYKF